MLKESSYVRQIPGEPRRRWFSSTAMDLIVWLGDDGGITGFQLCYDREKNERALTWRAPDRYTHAAVDDGEERAFRHKATPILAADGSFDAAAVAKAFEGESAEVPHAVVALVLAKLAAYPGKGG